MGALVSGLGHAATSVGNTVSTAVNNTIGKIPVVGPVAKLGSNILTGASNKLTDTAVGIGGGYQDSPDPPGQPGPDPRLVALQNKQTQAANDYRAAMPQTEKAAGDLAAGGIRADTSQGLKGITTGANQRGLLYSGLRQGEQGQLMGQEAGRIAGAQNKINTGVENQANNLDTAALGGAYNQAQAAFSPTDTAYDAAIRQRQGNLEAQQQLGKGAGGLIGQYYGQQAYNNTANPNDPYGRTYGQLQDIADQKQSVIQQNMQNSNGIR